MWVRMDQACVPMPMRVRFARRIFGRMAVLVVLVVTVEVFMLQRFMDVLVFVPLGNVQPDTGEHERSGDAKRPIEVALSDCEGERSTRKWRRGEISSRASRAEMAQRQHEKDEAHPVAEETDRCNHHRHREGGEM